MIRPGRVRFDSSSYPFTRRRHDCRRRVFHPAHLRLGARCSVCGASRAWNAVQLHKLRRTAEPKRHKLAQSG
jgi:hypothetical protein